MIELIEADDALIIVWAGEDRRLNVYPGDKLPSELSKKDKATADEIMVRVSQRWEERAVCDAAENIVFDKAVAEAKKAEDAEKKRLMREILIEEGVIPG